MDAVGVIALALIGFATQCFGYMVLTVTLGALMAS